VYVKNLQKKTSVSMLMITLWQMIIGSLLLGLGWGWLEAEPIRWTVALALLSATRPCWPPGWRGCSSTMRSGACRREWSPWHARHAGDRRAGRMAAMGERPAPLEATGMVLIGTALAMLAGSPRPNAATAGR